uniref:Uncharacterized protein n=1 Tax=Pithovirus LCPAC403 TaxID=2506596 RepID=A0A481ZE47_9VIRU|nr:MAG: uncharacterized protein LCPAC403_00550 [Pithovirus LCPAC403]
MSALEILTEIHPNCNPYCGYILERVKIWYGDVTFAVFDMMLSRVNTLTVSEAKECCRKICLSNCKQAGVLLGLEPPSGKVDLRHELSRHRLSSKLHCINEKYSYYYKEDRSFEAFSFSIVLSAKTKDEKRYAEDILGKYVGKKLCNIGFRGFIITGSIFVWEKSSWENEFIELPSCIRFENGFIDKLNTMKKKYIAVLGEY